MIVVSGRDKIDEIRRAPDEVLSREQANKEVISFAFPLHNKFSPSSDSRFGPFL